MTRCEVLVGSGRRRSGLADWSPAVLTERRFPVLRDAAIIREINQAESCSLEHFRSLWLGPRPVREPVDGNDRAKGPWTNREPDGQRS